MIKIKPTRLFNTIKSNKASLVHRLPIALVLFVLMLFPFAAFAQSAALTIENISFEENEGAVSINVLLNESIAEEVTARVTASGGTAVKGTDYVADDQTLTFAGTAGETQPFSIAITNDDIVELDETFTVSILSVSTTGITFADTAVVTINNDTSDTAELTIADMTVNEGDGSVELIVTLSQVLPENLTMTVGITPDTAVAADYTAPTDSLTINAGNRTGTISVPIENDDIVEGIEIFTVAVSNLRGTQLSGNVTLQDPDATVTIRASDGNAALMFADVTVNEGDVNATLTVRLSRVLGADLTMTVGTSDGTATRAGTDSDYTAPGTSLTINAGDMTGTISVPIMDDAIVESTEAFTVTVSNPAGDLASRVEGLPASATVMITDDDNATLTVADLSVDEDVGTADIIVMLGSALTADLTMTVGITPGTAVAADYTAPGTSLTINASNRTGTISVPIVDDAIVEGNETFTVTVSNLGGTLSGDVTLQDADAIVTINDNDGNANLTIADVTVNETDGTADLTVTLNNKELGADLTMTVGITPGTAVAADYTAPGTSLTIDEGNMTETISVPITDDNVVENTEAFTVTVSNLGGTLSGRVTLQDADAIVTITDDLSDVATVTVESALEFAENDGNAEITARLDNPVDGDLTVNVVINDDTAVRGQDYTVPANAALTFTGNDNAFNEEQFLDIPITDDDIADSTETFTVTYTLADNRGGRITLNRAETTVTISDNDFVGIMLTPTLTPPATLNIMESMTAAEESSTATYTVVLTSEPIAGDVTVDIVSINTATDSDNDVTVDPSTLTFMATGNHWRMPQTVEITVTKDPDAVDDSANLTHTATGADYTGTATTLAVTVTDPDTAGISFNPASVTILENDDMAVQVYTVILNTQPTADVTVAIESINAEITSSNNVTVLPEELIFTTDNWNGERTVTITARHDDDAVNDSANLTHTASGGDYDGLPVATLPVEVIDDEVAGISFNPAVVTVVEGTNNQTYTVVLDTQPTADVTVTIASINNNIDSINNNNVTVDQTQTTLTFSTDNWADEQEVTITAAEDDDAVNDMTTLMHTATGGDYTTANVSKELLVRVTDNDEAGITFSPASVTVDEGTNNQTYTVVLATQPTAEVTVTIDEPVGRIVYDSNDVPVSISVSENELTFTTSDWLMPQTVTVDTGNADDDNDDYEITFRHTATGGDYTIANAGNNVVNDLTINVTDTYPDDGISRDSRLSMLTISAADGAAALSISTADGTELDSDLEPLFDPNTTNYELIIDNTNNASTDVESLLIMLTPTLSDADSATAELILGEMESNMVVSGEAQAINLETGKNDDLQIIVTAGDNLSSRTYAITITRIDRVVLNDVSLVPAAVPAAATDCNAAPVAAVRAGGTYFACVERFPMDTAGMVAFGVVFNDMTTMITTQEDEDDLFMNTTRTDGSYMLASDTVSSSLTYLMMTVTFDMEDYVVRYPIIDNALAEQTDTDNDGIPDTEERGTNSPTNLVIADMAAGTTMRQIVVSDGQRIALGADARRAASERVRLGLATGQGVTYTAELNTTALAMIDIPEPPGYNGEGVYDFVVYLPTAEDTAFIAIPLASPLTAGRNYAKYKENDWSAFEPGPDHGEYYSAPGNMTTGACPSPDDLTAWSQPQVLTPGHRCILLEIKDGGDNDADGMRNGIVVDPGAPASISGGRSGGSGASDLWFLLLMLLISTLAIRRKQPLS